MTMKLSRGVAGLIGQYREKTLSPLEVIEEALADADASQASLAAFATIAHESARREAQAATHAYRTGSVQGPLAGVPITVKDILQTRGIRTTYGSRAFAGHVPTSDAESVARLRKAGAIIIGKTATPEFACRQTTSSAISGISRNPLDLRLTPGGSSGGAAAATASGIGTIAVVTDGGGSARLPAACTGTAGFKPTFGRIPFDAALDAFSGLGHIGLMAQNVEDIAVAFAIAAGPCDRDPYSLVPPGRSREGAAISRFSLEGIRVGWRERLHDESMDPAIQHGIRAALGKVERLGGTIVELEGEVDEPLPIWRTLQDAIWAERYSDNADIMADIDPVIRSGVERAASTRAQDLQRAMHGRTRLFRSVQSWFQSCDVVLSPTLTRTPLAAEHPGYGPIEIGGKPAGDIRVAWAPLLGLFTMTGHPSISLNCGWTPEGLPIGLHLTAPWHGDDALLSLAALLEVQFNAGLETRPASGVADHRPAQRKETVSW
ncbi:amidase [Agrobacterium tumefaciens]|uniref:amidase n=1 Tax=Agrobacterium tumefaciens TaxID=358 RepID=UPI0022087868|nr:amidase [Agrobacterium tumefaciens]